ncbi:MAG TPA: RES family NAD+ phosphorylase [Tepidisphaeraceae bacterium]|nr:RES family NAD+ phosphorylase [Tepidisphaeraceae bacterium]
MKRSSASAAGFRGRLYRACAPIYANTGDLLTGEGSRKVGGRWNRPRDFAIVYLAQTVEGAIAEALGLPGVFGFDPDSRLPLTLVAVEARLDVVLDLTAPAVRRVLAATIKTMVGCDWRNENASGREAITQALGRAAFDSGVQGIIVPSAVKRTFKNLNVFPARLGTAGTLRILRAENLPPPPPPGLI